MGIRESIAKALGWRFGTPLSGSRVLEMTEMQVPPGWGYQTYLQAYGQVGWLFACVNVIAASVAKVPWHLYEIDNEGEREEIFQHDLIDLLNHVNPYQTRYQFMYLGTMYKKLVGEEFWAMNFNGKGEPAEIWLAPPAHMSVIPHPTKYIDHYEFRKESIVVPFSVDEIIHIMTPNPYNPYRGLSEAQALTVDIDSERYAARYQQKLFFNEAVPGFVIKYPAESMPPAEVRKELLQEWDERYRGFRNRGKTAMLWGGDIAQVTLNNRDMDFATLRSFSRDAILGAYHVPRSVIGITEDVNRANAEAGNYTFAMYVIDPELAALREALNKELVPFFGDNLYLDYDNPIPEDTTAGINNAVNLFKAGVITRNDALQMIDMEPVDEPEGDEYFTQPSPFGGLTPEKPMDNSPTNETPMPKKLKAIDKDRASDEYTSRTQSYEAKTIFELQTMYLAQKQEALEKLKSAEDAKAQLLDLKKAKKHYKEVMTPVMKEVIAGALYNAVNLLEPENPHKQGPEMNIPYVMMRWLSGRIGWAAQQTSEETAAQLSAQLSEGFALGESIPLLSARVSAVFDNASAYRAERIARTEILQASAQGALYGYKQMGVTKVEFYPARDERECEDCKTIAESDSWGLGAGIWPVDEAEGVITVHPNCRCDWLPVIE